MTRRSNGQKSRGYFGIGIYHAKYGVNVGTLWRSAWLMGASFIFTIGERFPEVAYRNIVHADHALGQQSDTPKTHKHIPYMRFEDIEDMRQTMPLIDIVAVELDARSVPLFGFHHPKRCAYLLGAEDHGLPPSVLEECAAVVQLPGDYSMNVSACGTVVLYDRLAKVEAA